MELGFHLAAVFQEYYNAYRRGYADSIPPPIPWGLPHLLFGVLLLGGCTGIAYAFLQKK